MTKKVIVTIFVLTCLVSVNVFALNGLIEGEDGTLTKVEDSKYMGDTLWVLVAAFLVFFMQAGFAMVESGFTRAKKRCEHSHEKLDGLLNGVNRLLGNRLCDYVWCWERLHGNKWLVCSFRTTYCWHSSQFQCV